MMEKASCVIPPASPVCLAYESEMRDKGEGKFVAFNAIDGLKLWEIKCKWNEMVAVTPDGKRQAISDGKLIITSLPDSNVVEVEGVHGKVEGIFSQDSKYLLCLPALEWEEKEEINAQGEKRPVEVARRAGNGNELIVVDVKSGKVVKRLNLNKTP